ncbi:hypothetical protein [Novosphingobium sp. ST904]|uniref:hypothetical protein n=1 Tax=Novosphingobium sp. ST904 TaxID=1684385 RepID=UPI0006C83EFF|nr:hypothetical protein [Novosphingobium sp. ST904]KPH59184.1 hypothetical protein ADT71_23875 [Novosphingobium sp. ST904]TCM37727.1 hypothetical protein EDF59_110123 [Novosphingobium sp. ST904]
MADIYGTAHSGTDPLHRPSGIVVDAGVRRFRNTINLATEGGATTNSIIAAKVREGCAIHEVRMHSTVALTAVDFTIGTDDDPDKYGAAQAGPAAGASKTFQVPVAQLAADGLTEPDLVKFFPSAALPAAGTIVTEIFASKR